MQFSIEQLLDNMELVLMPYPLPMVVRLKAQYGNHPFLVLVACLLSLRSRDERTLPIILELWPSIATPKLLLAYPVEKLEAALYSLGFWRQKTAALRVVSERLLERFGGCVPSTEDELLSLPGVGRKTAHLVLAEAFDVPALCVDTHVHRIANHLGLVKTKTPLGTELALERLVPRAQWSRINRVLVPWGQYICRSSSRSCCCFETLASFRPNG